MALLVSLNDKRLTNWMGSSCYVIIYPLEFCTVALETDNVNVVPEGLR